MRFLKCFLNLFTTITTAILIVVTVLNLSILETGINGYFLPQILLSGATTALVTAAFFTHEYKKTRGYLIATAVHFVCLCGIMIPFGIWFGWMSADIEDILMMTVSVAAVYAITWVVTYLGAKKEADELNAALKNRK